MSEAESMADPTGTYQFTVACPERSRRNNMGRLTGTSTQYAFLTSRTLTTSYGYDAASNRTSFTDPENGSSSYVYDTLNRLQTLTPPTAYGTGSFGLGYDALSSGFGVRWTPPRVRRPDRRTSLTRPNTVNTSYGYDTLSRLLSVTHAKGGVTLDGATYTVDNAGNRNPRCSFLEGVTSALKTYSKSGTPLYCVGISDKWLTDLTVQKRRSRRSLALSSIGTDGS